MKQVIKKSIDNAIKHHKEDKNKERITLPPNLNKEQKREFMLKKR